MMSKRIHKPTKTLINETLFLVFKSMGASVKSLSELEKNFLSSLLP